MSKINETKLSHKDVREDIREVVDGSSSVAIYDKNQVQVILPLYESQKHLGGNASGVATFNLTINDGTGGTRDVRVQVPGDGDSWVPFLWDWLISTFSVSSVLDVGSGFGYASDYFSKKLVSTTAIEGLPYNVKNAVYPTELVDLSVESYVPDRPFDLVWSCEVAEHIDEASIDFFLDTVTNSKVLALTAAPPEDGGHHHVNCQIPDYWIDRIQDKGMKFSFHMTMKAREVSHCFVPNRTSHFARNGMIFVRK